MKHTIGDLRQMQSLPLGAKIEMTKRRIREWYDYWNGQVYVSFSGGKDSTVLLNIARELYPDIEAVFVDTGLEYPEIRQFVKTFDKVTILRPKMRFDEVIKTYGYPVISKDIAMTIHYAKQKNAEWAWARLNGVNCKNGKQSEYREQRYGKYKPLTQVDFNCSNWCCLVMKEKPLLKIEKTKKPITGILACESERRTDAWLKTGCNAFDSQKPISKPMSFWTENDVLQYAKNMGIKLASLYGDIMYKDETGLLYYNSLCGGKLCTTGCERTGCIFCGFGAHLDERNGGTPRFVRLRQTHPKQYQYCIGGGEYVDGIWQPNEKGLGMGHVFDELNKIFGDGFIKY